VEFARQFSIDQTFGQNCSSVEEEALGGGVAAGLSAASQIKRQAPDSQVVVLAKAIYKRMTVFELAELDLSYAPPYTPVWDPLLIAANQTIKEV
jgi:hypothetical protein